LLGYVDYRGIPFNNKEAEVQENCMCPSLREAGSPHF